MPFEEIKPGTNISGGFLSEATAKSIKNYTIDKSIGIGKEIFQYLASPLYQKYIKTVYMSDIVVNVNSDDDKRYVSIRSGTYTFILWFNIILRRKIKYKFVEDSYFLEFPDNGVYYRKINNLTMAIISVYEEFDKDGEEYNQRMKIHLIGKDAQKFYSILFTKVSKKNEQILTKFKEPNTIIRYKNNYTFSDLIHPKDINEIFMDADKRKVLLSSIKTFINNKDLYVANKIVHKIGYLFYGPPGTGKSSLAYSIANYLNYPVFLISPEYIYRYATSDDVDMIFAMSNRIVLLEEIDTMMKEYDMNSSNDGPSGALRKDHILKFIDDLPSGTILIANTNHFDKLDEAVIRSGRFDIKMEIPNFEKPEALQMIRYHNLDDAFADRYTYPICPSDLQFDIVREISKTLINRKDNDNE